MVGSLSRHYGSWLMYCYLFGGEASVMLAGVRSFLDPTGGQQTLGTVKTRAFCFYSQD